MALNKERQAKSTVAARTNAGLLRKSMTDAEKQLWNGLRYQLALPTRVHFRRQCAIGNYIVDFACLQYRLIIEVDGPIHDALNHVRRDVVRNEFMQQNGFNIMRFTNDDVLLRQSAVLNSIAALRAVTTPIRPLTRTLSPQRGKLELHT